jgi:uncharacterized membrane protein YgdD (TMEM256/DUF423 family)
MMFMVSRGTLPRQGRCLTGESPAAAGTSSLKGLGRGDILFSMTNTWAMRVAGLMGALAVTLGAFGAHGFKEILVRNDTVAIWEKAVFYHFIHTIMLFVLGARRPLPKGPWISFLAGIVVFSGSLYLLAYTNVRWLGAITPLGGLSFIVGWLWLAWLGDKAGA